MPEGASVVFKVNGDSPTGYGAGKPNIGDLAITLDGNIWIYVGGPGSGGKISQEVASNWKLLDSDKTDDITNAINVGAS